MWEPPFVGSHFPAYGEGLLFFKGRAVGDVKYFDRKILLRALARCRAGVCGSDASHD